MTTIEEIFKNHQKDELVNIEYITRLYHNPGR
jgi:hypothetical protein